MYLSKSVSVYKRKVSGGMWKLFYKSDQGNQDSSGNQKNPGTKTSRWN